MLFRYDPPRGLYVPGFKPGQLALASTKDEIAALRASACFKQVRKPRKPKSQKGK